MHARIGNTAYYRSSLGRSHYKEWREALPTGLGPNKIASCEVFFLFLP